jgi:hypothetical protein
MLDIDSFSSTAALALSAQSSGVPRHREAASHSIVRKRPEIARHKPEEIFCDRSPALSVNCRANATSMPGV